MADVTCIGVICADVIAKPVDSIPERGKLNLVNQLELHTGGCATNTAIDLAKIGIDTAIIGKIGKDGFGDFIYNTLKGNGVDVRGLKREEGLNTSASVVLVSGDGERTFLHCLGSNASFTENDVDFDVIKESKILFVAGALLMPAFDGEPASRVLKISRDMGVCTILDTAWDSTGRWIKTIKPCLPYVDFFMPSEDEARMLSGKEDPEEMADVFLEMGTRCVIIKLGSRGCFIKNDREKHLIPSFAVDAVDATGAGDSFVAGFITGLIKGWDLRKCGIFANAVGAHCVMAMGASNGIKPFDDIVEFIKGRKVDF